VKENKANTSLFFSHTDKIIINHVIIY
jgi:hypothetical protein